MLSVEAIHTYYGESHVLRGVSLTVNRGEIVAVLGRNGAGKSTAIRSVIGWTPPRRGSIHFDGRLISNLPCHRIALSGIGLVPQGRRIFPNLTVQENLQVAARPERARGGFDLDRVYQLFPRLAERRRNQGNQLSGGEQSLLSIGRALMGNVLLLLMDEPSEGLSPLMVREVVNVLRLLRDTGLPILLVEQNLSLALSVADRVYLLNKGQIVCETTPEGLQQDHALKQRYLGV